MMTARDAKAPLRGDPLGHIGANRHTLPKNQRRVADYLLNQWERALYESSMTIAKKLGVGQSTVVRTAVRLGYAGFPEIQAAFRALLEDRFSTTKRIEHTSNLQRGRTADQRIAQVFQQHRKNLDAALRDLDPREVVRAAELIWKADRVFVLGLRTSAALAHYLGFYLSMIRKNVTVLTSDYMLLENFRSLGQRDVVVAFSFIRYYRQTVEASRMARDQGCHIVGLTDTVTAPLSQIANILFLAPVASTHYNNSYVAVFAIIDILLSIISGNNSRAAVRALRLMEAGYDRLQMFPRP
jgi:DNA-binding MurR/RpiR family transcriptional regulator